MKSGKVWGHTELIEHTSSFEFHRIEFKANHCCSEHYHKTKWNGFFVESGRMLIRTWPDHEEPNDSRPVICDQTILKAGEYYKVEPGKSQDVRNIEFVPTFIFLRDSTEIGRIVESPEVSLEQDMFRILQTEDL